MDSIPYQTQSILQTPPTLCLPPSAALLRRRAARLGRTGPSNHGVQLLGGDVEARQIGGSALRVELADGADIGCEQGLEGQRDETALLVKPLGEGAGELEGGGLPGLRGKGDGEVV